MRNRLGSSTIQGPSRSNRAARRPATPSGEIGASIRAVLLPRGRKGKGRYQARLPPTWGIVQRGPYRCSVTFREPIAALEEVEVRVDGRRILGPVSMHVLPGERWTLLGPNGGGKTTLLSVLGARRQPSSGRARVLGTTFGRGDLRSM